MNLGEIPSASAMFEETMHIRQIELYGNVAESDNVERLAREIEANRKLLNHSKSYGFTSEDFADIKRNLSQYESDFFKLKGISYDESGIYRGV